MKNILQEYIPFEHDNLDYINGLIAFAREQKTKNTPESVIASAVIYANLVEYLVTHLLKNMRQMIYLVSYFQLQGILFYKCSEKKFHSKTLGQLKAELSDYEFPDKVEFIKILEKFNSSRNNLLHRLMEKKTEEEINKLDKDIIAIQENAEEILQKYNVISQGLQNIWATITQVPPTPTTEEKNK